MRRNSWSDSQDLLFVLYFAGEMIIWKLPHYVRFFNMFCALADKHLFTTKLNFQSKIGDKWWRNI